MRVRLATGPVCWGVDTVDDAANPPWSTVLAGIARAGFRRLELGPLGYLPRQPDRLAAELASRGLSAAGAFVFHPLDDRRGLTATAEETAALASAVGAAYLLIIDAVAPPRERTAGRPEAATRLGARGRRELLAAVRAVAEIASERGLLPLVHPHAGTWIELPDEIEAVAEAAPVCLDTGHCAYSGIDPVAMWRRLGDRVRALHVKDVDRSTLRRVTGAGAGFWAGVRAGVFCPLGRGIVDVEALSRTARAARFDGWVTLEQDRAPGTGDPVADLVASRELLERAGFYDDARPEAA
jgi:inosose dehydratase